METSVGTEDMRDNVLSPALSPEGTDHPLCPWESICEASVKEWVNLVYYNLWYALLQNQNPGSTIHLEVGGRHEGSLILSKAPDLEILRYGLAKKFIHVCCSILWKTSKELFGQFFSDPVFWTKPQGTHLLCPLRNQKRFWVATSSLLPGALLLSLWVLQEQKNFTSREDL